MTKLEIAARQALDALEELFHSNSTKVAVEKYNIAHNALREALDEQAEQRSDSERMEPVAWVTAKESFCGFPKLVFSETQKNGYKPLYAAPVRTKDLTDDEIYEAFYSCGFGATIAAGGRAIIAAYREKNK